MLNFVLCEDNLVILDKLSRMLESLFIKHNFDADIAFKSCIPEEALDYVQHNDVNVLVLDINLKSTISGIDLAKKVRETNKQLYIIFLTGHLEYVLVAYQVKTFDYIPKPITLERLEETLLRLYKDMENNRTKYIIVGNQKALIKPSDIKYIKKNGMKLIYTTYVGEYEEYSSFTKIEDTLPKYFARCHKSFIVNLNNINYIKANLNTIFFEDDDCCYIGPKYKNKFMEVLNNYGNFRNILDNVSNA